MAVDEDRYSRVVGWLKILLPLLALGILSMLFLVSKDRDPDGTLPYSEVDVRELAREARIGRPAYSGVTRDGTIITVSAATARPDPEHEDGMLIDDLTAILESDGDVRTEVRGGSGRLDSGRDALMLFRDVRITTSTVYSITSDAIEIGLDQTWLESPGPVNAAAPFGSLTAGSLRLDRADDGDQTLVFKNGVRLLYQPASLSESR